MDGARNALVNRSVDGAVLVLGGVALGPIALFMLNTDSLAAPFRADIPELRYATNYGGFFGGAAVSAVEIVATAGAAGFGKAGRSAITVTEGMIREAMKDAPLASQQAGGVSLPTVQRYVNKLIAGELPPAIKVDGNIIVDGNHRYIAGRIFGTEPPIQPWAGGRGPIVPWGGIKISNTLW